MNRNEDEISAIRIEDFIQSVLALCGLRRGRDYTIRRSQLRIKKHPVRGKLVNALRTYYPQYSYYWETPKLLRWF